MLHNNFLFDEMELKKRSLSFSLSLSHTDTHTHTHTHACLHTYTCSDTRAHTHSRSLIPGRQGQQQWESKTCQSLLMHFVEIRWLAVIFLQPQPTNQTSHPPPPSLSPSLSPTQPTHTFAKNTSCIRATFLPWGKF